MSKLLKVTLLVIFAVGLIGAYRNDAAQEGRTGLGRNSIHFPRFAAEISPDALATKHVLEGTYNSSGNFDATVTPSNATAISLPLTISCPGTTGTCTIQADMWIQNGAQTSNHNTNLVCLYIDGAPLAFCDFEAGESPNDGTLVQTSSSQGVSGLARGNHTVQTYFWTENGAYVGYYNSNYRVYKP
jgi:hypothetical protein